MKGRHHTERRNSASRNSKLMALQADVPEDGSSLRTGVATLGTGYTF